MVLEFQKVADEISDSIWYGKRHLYWLSVGRISGDVSTIFPSHCWRPLWVSWCLLIGLFCSWDCNFDDTGVRMALNGHISLQGLCFLLLSPVVDAKGRSCLFPGINSTWVDTLVKGKVPGVTEPKPQCKPCFWPKWLWILVFLLWGVN